MDHEECMSTTIASAIEIPAAKLHQLETIEVRSDFHNCCPFGYKCVIFPMHSSLILFSAGKKINDP
jgi:hypothetical protein